MTKSKYNNIIAYTDGSCVNNGKNNAKAGIGIYFPACEFSDVSEPFIQSPITNQRAELYAIYKALTIITEKSEFDQLYIYSDSLYSINCVTNWIKKWEVNNWKGSSGKAVMNLDIIKPIYEILKQHKEKITFKWVRGHNGDSCNEAADELACAGTLKNK